MGKPEKLNSTQAPRADELWRVHSMFDAGKSDAAIAAALSAARTMGDAHVDPRQIALIRAER